MKNLSFTEKNYNSTLYFFTPILVILFIACAELAITFNSVLLPNLKDVFALNDKFVQITIALPIFALGLAGLIFGHLADAIGRRPILLFSLSVFCLGSLIACFAKSVPLFLLARFFQGIGSGASWVVGNACIQDLFKGKKCVQVMNYVHAFAGLVSAVGPLLGAYILQAFGWRYCFIAILMLSLIAFLATFCFQSETLESKDQVRFQYFLQDVKNLFSNSKFICYLIVKVSIVMLLFCDISNMPLILMDYLGVSAKHYGLYILVILCGYVLSVFASSALVKYIRVSELILIGLGLILASNLCLFFFSKIISSPVLWIECMKLFGYFGFGCIFGNATSEIVGAFPKKAGLASAIMIALEMLMSALGIYFLTFFFNGTIYPLSLFFIAVSSVSFAVLKYSQAA